MREGFQTIAIDFYIARKVFRVVNFTADGRSGRNKKKNVGLIHYLSNSYGDFGRRLEASQLYFPNLVLFPIPH